MTIETMKTTRCKYQQMGMFTSLMLPLKVSITVDTIVWINVLYLLQLSFEVYQKIIRNYKYCNFETNSFISMNHFQQQSHIPEINWCGPKFLWEIQSLTTNPIFTWNKKNLSCPPPKKSNNTKTVRFSVNIFNEHVYEAIRCFSLIELYLRRNFFMHRAWSMADEHEYEYHVIIINKH